ncbi:maleylacetate reductase [Roseinatronobacter bogoriensis]|uniref:Maleylacetate reductase n=1 Tax=Roseinatronobacter bogoriensis subsp. barguzinensis TaxID=441209 RepID=A0A2K8KCC3_9RHOB|nr:MULTISPECIES: maleylacetate reductase [Rhodobaca]ATX66626.1 maleylacetate reductase [Rhodobaca barguzinensis]MBB4207805.1 maleylacetate reductase [Rhodobaca bogoriensis DSM 18756]TDW39889.1 maleylacetate reductase [Rhodobaca barguzinensis]TDY70958.1 maleylacetate reductase [Rhodobaca bogoriensis DSM 18756]
MTDLAHGFTFPGITSRVIFGAGTLGQTAEEIGKLSRSRALVLSTPEQADAAKALAARLGGLCVGTFCDAAMHTPVAISERAVAQYRDLDADCVVSIGGGSTIGLGKAIATRTGADQIAIPTTYAGSEMTDILGETEGGQKTTRRDPSIRPEVVIYDVDLTLSLPAQMTVTSALNAIAHGVEAIYAPDANPILTLMALDAMRAFRDGLPRVADAPADKAARAQVLYGAWLCSTALGYVTMALHHKLAHVLGGSFDMPHAQTHAILLPHTAGFNAAALRDVMEPVAEIFGGSVGGGLWDFAQRTGAPMRLRDLGLSEADLDRAADIATRNPYHNPRPFDAGDIRALLQAAWEGARPET